MHRSRVPTFLLLLLAASCALALPAPALADSGRVPILMYHYIEQPPKRKNTSLFIQPSTFDAQLQWLQDHGYTTVDPREMTAIINGTEAGPAKPIMLTFDDGWADASSNVLPALQRHGMKGVFYIITGFVGKPGFLTKQGVIALDQAGMTIGAHTVSHVDLRKAKPKKAAFELRQSKNDLEALLGKPVVDLAYPAGKYNASVKKLATDAGYATAVTVKKGVASDASDALELPRIRMLEETHLSSNFLKKG